MTAVPIDREQILKRAEKLLRQGRLDAAIADYVAVVTDFPADWATANLLGDLYVRAGQVSAASQQYTRIAEHLATEGFTAKAAALFKKVIKLNPADEHALMRAAELASRQGLTADVRAFMAALTQLRLRRGDREGVVALARARVAFDPADVVGRLDAARMLAEAGETAGAAGELRVAAQTLEAQGRLADALRAWREAARFDPSDTQTGEAVLRILLLQDDVGGALAVAQTPAQLRYLAGACRERGLHEVARDATQRLAVLEPEADDVRAVLARQCLEAGDPAGAVTWASVEGVTERPDLALMLAEAYLRQGRLDEGQTLLAEVVSRDPDRAASVARLAETLLPIDPDAAAAAVIVAVDTDVDRGDAAAANDRLMAFGALAPDALSALRRHIDVCVDGGFDTDLRRVQLRLADALIRRGEWTEARFVLQDLLASAPDDARYLERSRTVARALGVPLAVEEAEVFGQALGADDGAWPGGPATGATGDEPASLSDEFADLVRSLVSEGPPLEAEPQRPAPAPAGLNDGPGVGPADVVAPRRGGPTFLVVDEDLRRLFEEGEPARPVEAERAVVEVDLSDALSDMGARGEVMVGTGSAEGAPDPETLDGFFRLLRESRQGEHADAERQFEDGVAARTQGRFDAAAAHFRAAARDPALRGRASRELAALARSRGDLPTAIEWLERAVETPAESVDVASDVLYELADTLLAIQEDARALAVLLELQAATPGFRDVPQRIAVLTAARHGGRARDDGGRV